MMTQTIGTILFDNPAFSIGPDTTRSSFLSSEVGRVSKSAVSNEPWHSWDLPPMTAANATFYVRAFFHGDHLTMVTLTNADPQFGSTWNDYSDANERARKQSHDRWLAECCHLSPGKFPWGTISSTFGPDEPWAGISSIVVKYDK